LVSLKPGYYRAQQTYTFTNASATGSAGPTQAQVTAAYLSTNLNGSVSVSTQGIQTWTVPQSGVYRIEARGAQGYGTYGGKGASIAGDFTLTAGQVLKIVVGQLPLAPPASYTSQYAGGGGSFVTYTNNAALVVAGGGGGSWSTSLTTNSDGTISTSGNPGVNGTTNALGGTGGNGGGVVNNSCGGGGLSTDGAGNAGGFAFVNGAMGGSLRGTGGFGGGGGTASANDNRRGAGGGGYSGGGGSQGSSSNPEGGGGGSFNGGSNQLNTSGANSGVGIVLITQFCSIAMSYSSPNGPGPLCTGNSATLSSNAVSNFSWSTGATTSSIVVTPSATTSYTLSATSAFSCTTSAVITVTMGGTGPTLTVVSTASNGICPGKTATLIATGATTYTWTGPTTVTNGVSFTPTISSNYSVTGQNSCGSATAIASVSLHTLPTITVTVTQPTLCSGTAVTFSASGTATAYIWSGGVTNGVPFAPPTTAVFTSTGTSAQNCTVSASTGVTVVNTPSLAPVATPPLICYGKSSTLSASGAANYTWLPVNVNTSSTIVSPTITTTYTITKSNSNCVHTTTVKVTVNNLPTVIAIASPTIVCASRPAVLSAGGAATYTWTAPSYSSIGANVTVSPSVTTLYSVAASDGTCVNSTTLLLSTNPNPTITISASSSVICRTNSVSLTATGGVSYTWTAASSSTVSPSIIESPSITTLYNVTGENAFNCTTTAQQVVIVNPNPTITAVTNKTLVCIAGTAVLTAGNTGGGPVSYLWDINANGATTSTTTVNPLVTTIYTVTGTYTVTGCSSNKTVQVSVFSPSFAVNSPTSSCFGGTINLTASGANSYTWAVGSGIPFPTISVSPPTATVYLVSATSQSNAINCVSSNSVNVSIYANPTITAVGTRTFICKNEVTKLIGGGGATYQWSDPQSQTGGTIIVGPQVQTTYTVMGTDQNGCKGTGTVQIRVSLCPGFAESNPEFQGIDVYPNPARGNFKVKAATDMTVILTNELGQNLGTIVLSNENGHEVKISDLSAGIYFLSIAGKEGTPAKKIILTD